MALCRRLPPPSRPRQPRGVAAGARQHRFRSRRNSRSRRVRSPRDHGQGRDCGERSGAGAGRAGNLGPDRERGRPRWRDCRTTGGAEPDRHSRRPSPFRGRQADLLASRACTRCRSMQITGIRGENSWKDCPGIFPSRAWCIVRDWTVTAPRQPPRNSWRTCGAQEPARWP